MAMLGFGEAPAELMECFVPTLSCRAKPGIEHQIGEIAVLFEIAEDGSDFADHELEHRDLFIEQIEHLLFKGAGGYEIEHKHFTGLPNPVDASDPLLDRHW